MLYIDFCIFFFGLINALMHTNPRIYPLVSECLNHCARCIDFLFIKNLKLILSTIGGEKSHAFIACLTICLNDYLLC